MGAKNKCAGGDVHLYGGDVHLYKGGGYLYGGGGYLLFVVGKVWEQAGDLYKGLCNLFIS